MAVMVELVGPKARPKGVVDGQQVNIPVPGSGVMRGWRKVATPDIGIPVQACREKNLENPVLH